MSKPKTRTRSKRHVPPSRIRYEKANPTVSIRISKDMRAKLDELKNEHGLSLGEVLRIALKTLNGLLEHEPELEVALRQWEGYAIAEEEYKITFVCSRCKRRHLSCTDIKTREAAARLLYQAGWHSPSCR